MKLQTRRKGSKTNNTHEKPTRRLNFHLPSQRTARAPSRQPQFLFSLVGLRARFHP